jgi:hypothetical protein
MLRLKIPSEKATDLLAERLDQSYAMKKDPRTGYSYNDVLRWTVTTRTVLEGIYGPYDTHVSQFENIRLPRSTGDMGKDSFNILELFRNLLIAYLEEVRIYAGTEEFREPVPVVSLPVDNRDLFSHVFERFPKIVQRLENRGPQRTPLVIADTADVADLLQALLTPVFDDIRREDPDPSTGCTFARMSFVVRDQKIVLVAKAAGASDTDDAIVNELLVEIRRCRDQKTCRVLVCFLYDPGARLRQPRLMKNYLEHHGTDESGVVVLIKP